MTCSTKIASVGILFGGMTPVEAVKALALDSPAVRAGTEAQHGVDHLESKDNAAVRDGDYLRLSFGEVKDTYVMITSTLTIDLINKAIEIVGGVQNAHRILFGSMNYNWNTTLFTNAAQSFNFDQIVANPEAIYRAAKMVATHKDELQTLEAKFNKPKDFYKKLMPIVYYKCEIPSATTFKCEDTFSPEECAVVDNLTANVYPQTLLEPDEASALENFKHMRFSGSPCIGENKQKMQEIQASLLGKLGITLPLLPDEIEIGKFKYPGIQKTVDTMNENNDFLTQVLANAEVLNEQNKDNLFHADHEKVMQSVRHWFQDFFHYPFDDYPTSSDGIKAMFDAFSGNHKKNMIADDGTLKGSLHQHVLHRADGTDEEKLQIAERVHLKLAYKLIRLMQEPVLVAKDDQGPPKMVAENGKSFIQHVDPDVREEHWLVADRNPDGQLIQGNVPQRPKGLKLEADPNVFPKYYLGGNLESNIVGDLKRSREKICKHVPLHQVENTDDGMHVASALARLRYPGEVEDPQQDFFGTDDMPAMLKNLEVFENHMDSFDLGRNTKYVFVGDHEHGDVTAVMLFRKLQAVQYELHGENAAEVVIEMQVSKQNLQTVTEHPTFTQGLFYDKLVTDDYKRTRVDDAGDGNFKNCNNKASLSFVTSDKNTKWLPPVRQALLAWRRAIIPAKIAALKKEIEGLKRDRSWGQYFASFMPRLNH